MPRSVAWLGWWLVLAVVAGCGGGEGEGGDKGGAGTGVEGAEGQPSGGGGGGPTAAPPVAPEGQQRYFDLLAHGHLADLDHRGLFVDFGTPARAKYTVGHWHSGWVADGVDGDTTFSYAGKRGRFYFPVEQPGPLTLRMRLKPIGATFASAYFNGKELDMVRFGEGAGFRDVVLKVPAERVRAGENALLLVFGGTAPKDGKQVSVAMDWIHVEGGSPVEGFEPPLQDVLRSAVELGGQEREALAVPRPSRLSFHVRVPKAATLAFAVGFEGEGATPARLVARADGMEPVELWKGEATGRWEVVRVSLEPVADRVVRLDFVADGEGKGRIAWAEPGIYVDRAPKPKGKRAKNIVVLLIDTLRADALRIYNPRSRVETPHLTQLAREGAILDAQSPENWTKPSCASILTSLFPSTHRTKLETSKLPDAALTLPEHLRQHGFTTASFIANGYVSRKFGFDQGWDHYTNYIRENKSTEAENVFREAGDWIEAHKGRRFFAYIQTIDPHVPYDPPERLLKKYDPEPYDGPIRPRLTPQQVEDAKKGRLTLSERDRRRLRALYDAEIAYHDEEFGKFLERLRKLGVLDETVFVVVSDHGEEFGEHGRWGHGHGTYQEMVHVPFVVRFPGAVPAGQRLTQTVSTMDVGPTVLELAGVPPFPYFEGRSLAGMLRGEELPEPQVAFSDHQDDARTIRSGRWKLQLRGNNPHLFDLVRDPGEQQELAPQRAPIAHRYLRVLLGQFLGASNRSKWTEADQGEGLVLRESSTNIDPETRQHLKALGYAN